ncbi:hypothetical protein LTR85_005404 [Meristemomyces frigidus]|nr:hypothetical protein LTR85_005404 [Meristemomyces frigidus]
MAQTGQTLKADDLGLGDEEEEPLDVLDLPQLYTKPTYTTLLATLADLSSEPPSWDATPRSGTPRSTSGASTPSRKKRKVKSEGVPSYLTKIISSPLAWLQDDEEKERVWEAASQRLSERSGRTGMGAISRTFRIPLSAGVHDSAAVDTAGGLPLCAEDDDDEEDVLQIRLHEPALTADNLGLKTWASSYLLAKRLVALKYSLPPLAQGAAILELGAGTGLVGIAAAAVFKTDVFLTDLPDIVPNLERNAKANSLAIASHGGGEVHTAVLDWSDPAVFTLPPTADAGSPGPAPRHSFPLILAADPIYSPEHPRLLVQAIAHHLSLGEDARVVVEMPIRDAYAAEREDFRDRMRGLGLGVVGEGEEVGFDDWGAAGGCGRGGEGEEELAEVRCWWSVWGWS